jgi:hypothetical protein
MLCIAIAASLLLPMAAAPTPAFAQRDANFDVSLGYFASRLEPFGHWINHPVWGDAWQPDAGPNFRPYFFGYWEYTSDAGWMWVSNEPYGDIVYHYGRWVYDPALGWLWVPGYVWAPSWVIWREGEDYVGWFPMPPAYNDIGFDQTPALSYAPEASYGYEPVYGATFVSEAFTNLWIFTQVADFGHHDRRHYVTDHDRLRDLFHRSKDSTHYVNENDRVVDRSIDPRWLEGQTNQTITGGSASRFLHRNVPMETVSQGREIFRQWREGGAARVNASLGPAGTGGSAGANERPRIRTFGDRAPDLNPPGLGANPSPPRAAGLGTFGRNPVARMTPAPTAPAIEPPPPGQPAPRRIFGNGLPGSRMHVVSGIGPSTDGISPSPTPSPVPAVPVNPPRIAGFPSGLQPRGLAVRHAPGPVMAPIVAPPAVAVHAPPAAPAPVQAPATAPPATAPLPSPTPGAHFTGRRF